MRTIRWIHCAAVLLLATAVTFPVIAQQPATSAEPSTAEEAAPKAPAQMALEAVHGQDGEGRDGPMGKLSLRLSRLYYGVEPVERTGVAFSEDPSILQVQSGRVAVTAVASGDVATALPALRGAGMEITATATPQIAGWIPITNLPDLAALEEVAIVNPSFPSVSRVGDTTTQGDEAQKSDEARTNYGVDGTGAAVGVISDSYDTSTTASGSAADDIASGDLPAGGVTVLDDGDTTDIDEGRAMLQIVHDVAPGADLLFHTAGASEADFASAISDLDAAGSDVIVDDIIFLAEPMFMDGVVAQAVDSAFANGKAYFSSAGNNGTDSWEDTYSSSGVAGENGGTLHDFGAGDTCQTVTISGGGATTRFVLQWDQPFESVCGASCSGASSELQVNFYADTACSTFLFASPDSNTGGDAVDILGITNGGGTSQAGIAIEHISGPTDLDLKVVVFDGGGSFSYDEHTTNSPTLYGHANAAGAEAVGAAAFFQTPEFGQTPPLLESFSSPGGVPILFDITGSALPSPDVREKPEIVGPDGGNNTFFGSDLPDPGFSDPDTFPNFFGTSASAPHVAGIAALMIDREDTARAPGESRALTPSTIYSDLESTAIDMDVAGFDFNTGYGLVDANAAVGTTVPVELLSFEIR